MDEKTYERWWQLHLRVAKGETLLAEEKVEYETGSALMDSLDEEGKRIQENDQLRLEKLRSYIDQLETRNQELIQKNKELDKKIKRLEKAYRAVAV